MRSIARATAIAALAASMLLLGACAPIVDLVRSVSPASETYELPDPQPSGSRAAYESQQPVWTPCGDGMECAEVYAPLDWQDLDGDAITLRLVKHPAAGGEAIGTLFVNPGGPGASGFDYVRYSVEYAVSEAVLNEFDVIGWDPRGVGASSPVRCYDAEAMDEYLFGAPHDEQLEPGSDAWIDAGLAGEREFAEACSEGTGELLGHVSTAETVQDLDMLRGIVGDERLHYLGYSYGTYIGARYADAFPERVGRLVLDGAMDPTSTLTDVVREQTRGFELALRAYATDCLQRRSCPLEGDVDAAMRSIGALLDRVEAEPITGSDGRTVGSRVLLTAIITPLYSQSNWGALDELLTSVNAGQADTALRLADSYYDRSGGEYRSNMTEAFSAVNCLDYPSGPLDRDRMRADAAELDRIAPTIGRFQGYSEISCAEWPATGPETREPVRGAGADPILVVGTTGDPATPYRWAESLAQQLESGVLVTFEGEGHTAYGDNECVDEAVDAYLLTGAVPDGDPRCS